MDRTFEGNSPAAHGMRREPSGARWSWSHPKTRPVTYQSPSSTTQIEATAEPVGTDPTVKVQIGEVLGRLRKMFPDKDFLSLVEMVGASPDATDEVFAEAARELARPV